MKMYKILVIQISIIIKVLANTVPENKTYVDLVKEKGALFKEINEAIDESIAVLKKNNDTEAVLGIEYMNQLKEQLRDRNETDITPSKNDSDIDTRRRNKVTLNMAEIAEFLQSRGDAKKTEKKMLADQNKKRVQKELDMWMIEKRLEAEKKAKKKKIIKYKEKCPRWGHGKKKKKKVASRRQAASPTEDRQYNCTNATATTRKSRSNVYPCCRKCCKNSYMGCL